MLGMWTVASVSGLLGKARLNRMAVRGFMFPIKGALKRGYGDARDVICFGKKMRFVAVWLMIWRRWPTGHVQLNGEEGCIS